MAKKLIKPSAKLKFGAVENYSPLANRARDFNENKKEYIRLREILRKRLVSMKKAGFEDSEFYRQNVKRFPLYSSLDNKKQINYLLVTLAYAIKKKSGTVTGMREQIKEQLETLHKHHYDFVNEKNIISFGNFMEAVRIAMGNALYDSSEAAEYYEENMQEHGEVSPERLAVKYREWAEKMEQQFI